jgi:hypothetical protein
MRGLFAITSVEEKAIRANPQDRRHLFLALLPISKARIILHNSGQVTKEF